MSVPDTEKRVPASTRPFFQEYNFDLLDIGQHALLIIERILAFGNRTEVRWLIDTYGREQIREWMLRTGASRLTKRRYHLWCFVFDLPEKDFPARVWPH